MGASRAKDYVKQKSCCCLFYHLLYIRSRAVGGLVLPLPLLPPTQQKALNVQGWHCTAGRDSHLLSPRGAALRQSEAACRGLAGAHSSSHPENMDFNAFGRSIVSTRVARLGPSLLGEPGQDSLCFPGSAQPFCLCSNAPAVSDAPWRAGSPCRPPSLHCPPRAGSGAG